MEQSEYQELVELLGERLRSSGLANIASVGDVVFDQERDEYRAAPARERLIRMLRAFDRHLAARDPTTLESALQRINGVLEEGRVDDVLFDSLDDTTGVDSQSLRGRSFRRPLREELGELIRGVQED